MYIHTHTCSITNAEERVKEPTNSFSSMGMAAAASSAG